MQRTSFFLFVRDPEQNMSGGKKETITVTTFKKLPFMSDFRIETEDGKLLSALCKYCFKLEYNDYMREARSRNFKGYALKLIVFFFQESVTYIHQSTFTCHVGTSASFHHWWKEKIRE